MSEKPISPLRRRMLEDMSLRGFTPDTQRDYIRAVKKLAAFLGRSPRGKLDGLPALQDRLDQLRAQEGETDESANVAPGNAVTRGQLQALEAQTSETSAAQRQLDLALQQARFSAAHARRQYDAVDPDNRLVAGELERRWNEALQVVYRLEGEVAALEARKPAPLGEKERRHLLQLGADLELAWSHPAATAATRKRILRAALYEIVVRIEGSLIESTSIGPSLRPSGPSTSRS